MSKRFSYSTVGYGVFSLFGEKYRMGRIEVYDRENESGYAVDEGIYSIPHDAARQFEDFMDSLETDLPIHIEIGNHRWCDEECAKSLGFENSEEMNNPDNVKVYRLEKNNEFAREHGYKDFDDMLANSKFGIKANVSSSCEYSGLPSVESYQDEFEKEDKTFKQKSKWQSIDRKFKSKK